MAGGGRGPTLEKTPTYAVAISVALFIGISLLVERIIHSLKKRLKHRGQKPLKRVLDKLTNELMLLGFMSLLLTVLEDPLTKICVSHDFANSWLPCKAEEEEDSAKDAPDAPHRRLLASLIDSYDSRRMLAGGASDYCQLKGKTAFVSLQGLHQLHIFIFVLGVTHVTYSLISVLLGYIRICSWKDWEPELAKERSAQKSAQKIKKWKHSRPEPEGANISADIRRDNTNKSEKVLVELIQMKLKGEGGRGCSTSFLDRHMRRYENPVTLWIICFFQQFVASISKEDYLLFRVGFTTAFEFKDDFTFLDYIKRAMESDFKCVIGISWGLWVFVVLFLLLNVYGWYTYFWASLIPTILVLIIGTKQQHIISVLALKAKRHAREILNSQKEDIDLEEQVEARTKLEEQVETGIKDAIKPSDDLFWFRNPKILLKLIHFVIFQNSFELAILFWILVTFGWNSCILGHRRLVIIRVVVGAVTIFLSSYSIIPIYSLVTQMTSKMKMEALAGPRVARGIDKWLQTARKNALANPGNGVAGNGPIEDPVPEDEPLGKDPLYSTLKKFYGKETAEKLQRLHAHRIAR